MDHGVPTASVSRQRSTATNPDPSRTSLRPAGSRSRYHLPSRYPSCPRSLKEQYSTPPGTRALRMRRRTEGRSSDGTCRRLADAHTPSNSSTNGSSSKRRLSTRMPSLSSASRQRPSDPSTGTASNPSALNATVSLQEPLPRSSILAPGSRWRRKRERASDRSRPMVASA